MNPEKQCNTMQANGALGTSGMFHTWSLVQQANLLLSQPENLMEADCSALSPKTGDLQNLALQDEGWDLEMDISDILKDIDDDDLFEDIQLEQSDKLTVTLSNALPTAAISNTTVAMSNGVSNSQLCTLEHSRPNMFMTEGQEQKLPGCNTPVIQTAAEHSATAVQLHQSACYMSGLNSAIAMELAESAPQNAHNELPQRSPDDLLKMQTRNYCCQKCENRFDCEDSLLTHYIDAHCTKRNIK